MHQDNSSVEKKLTCFTNDNMDRSQKYRKVKRQTIYVGILKIIIYPSIPHM